MSETTTALSCKDCDKRIESCACCDEEDCGAAICFECLVTELGQSLAQPHDHGG